MRSRKGNRKFVCQENMTFDTPERVAPPRGRPPQNYVWDPAFGYVHFDTGAPFDRDAQKAVLRARKTAIERRRYLGLSQRGSRAPSPSIQIE
jgi:hypothetical protein